MKIDFIINKFRDRESNPMGIEKTFSVMLPLVFIDNEWHILFEVRSNKLDTQPGEISLPGGGIEEGETPEEAAIRETSEELNISYDKIEVIGKLDYLSSPFNMIVYGYVGILKDIKIDNIKFNKEEVSEIFTVPVDFFVDNEPQFHHVMLKVTHNDEFPYHLIPNGKNYKWRKAKSPELFYLYKNYVIWGLTARFIKNFVDILNNSK